MATHIVPRLGGQVFVLEFRLVFGDGDMNAVCWMPR